MRQTVKTVWSNLIRKKNFFSKNFKMALLKDNRFYEFCTILQIQGQIASDPDKKAIEKAFRKAALKTHPDKVNIFCCSMTYKQKYFEHKILCHNCLSSWIAEQSTHSGLTKWYTNGVIQDALLRAKLRLNNIWNNMDYITLVNIHN